MRFRLTLHLAFFLLLLPASRLIAQGRVLKVMTFNVRFGSSVGPGDNVWENRRSIVIDLIRKYSPHVVGCQEVLKDQFTDMQRGLASAGYASLGEGRRGGHNDEHMAIFYRADLLRLREAGNFWLSETPEVPGSQSWNSACPRMVTWARFAYLDGDHEFYFFNTHFDHISETARRLSACLLLRRTSVLRDATAVVLVGDFNSQNGTSAVWYGLTGQFEQAANMLTAEEQAACLSISQPYSPGQLLPFQDAWQTAAIKRNDPPAIPPSGWGPGLRGLQTPIDWILYRGKVKANVIEVVTYNENGRYPSDHFPYYAELMLNPAAG
jgi:endonuclease/exonuclease/phosphatase family metal-dependent hydrolase